MKDDPAQCTGTHHLKMLGESIGNNNVLEWITEAVLIVVAGTTPDDGRSALVVLTPLGEERAAQALRAAADTNALGLTPLSPDERAVFLDMLRRVVQHLDAADKR